MVGEKKMLHLDLQNMVNSLIFLHRLRFLQPGFQSESTSTSHQRVWYHLRGVERGRKMEDGDKENGRWRQSSFPQANNFSFAPGCFEK